MTCCFLHSHSLKKIELNRFLLLLRCGIGLFCLGRLIFGLVLVVVTATPKLLAMMWKFGLILLVCWSSGLVSSILYIGLLLNAVLVWVVRLCGVAHFV